MTNNEADDDDWKFPLLLSSLAGASTSVGAAIVFLFDSKQIQQSMPFSLSLAASVMITVSLVSIFPECLKGVIEVQGNYQIVMMDVGRFLERLFSFGLGCFSYWGLSKLLQLFLLEPESILFGNKNGTSTTTATNVKNGDDLAKEKEDGGGDEEQVLLIVDNDLDGSSSPSNQQRTMRRTNTVTRQASTSLTYSSSHDASSSQEENLTENYSKIQKEEQSKRRSWRVTMLLFFSLLCHNFPEGLAVVASTVESKQLGITVAIGILIHNIPEGIAIAVPCIAARPDDPWLAFWLASGSGLAEPLGAIVALGCLKYGRLPLENVLACVAGIMCMVAVLELYPEAYRSRRLTDNKSNHQNRSMMMGTLCGMTIMIVTEWYLP